MKKISLALFLGILVFAACKSDDSENQPIPNAIVLKNHSKTPLFLKKMPGFEKIKLFGLISSEDTYLPNFTYGSMADGAGLLRNPDGTFTLINNIEADYSIARILLDKTFKPIQGEYILNATATANTAQCSGSMIEPQSHGFGPIYLSGGEWGGSSKGVFATDPYRDASAADVPNRLSALGEWSTENAVCIGKDAYPDKTVIFIGDDHSNNNTPSGQLGMYVGKRGDLENGKLYALKVIDPQVRFEVDMKEGKDYKMEFLELEQRTLDLLDAESKAKGIMGFSRLEDLDWRRGSGANNREIYMCVTGRKKTGLIGKGTIYGRVYKITLNPKNPYGKGTIRCILDGDIEAGKAWGFHSPDNIVVTQNYAYIQEDPNGYFDLAEKKHFARLYQYNLTSGALRVVLECDQEKATRAGYGSTDKIWELTGMIDISDPIGVDQTFILITQNHGWEKSDGSPFTDPNANPDLSSSRKEGSMLYIVQGLER